MTTDKENQRDLIIKHMQEHPEGITRWEAYELYGITELNTRIHELRREGVAIAGFYESGENRRGRTVKWMRYRLSA